ncbi:MAG TPA: type III pantothenate kinase [Symbiobacteriaceae bacterium]|jgi:type III pantothenate kinase|nr:type III pantothenate kinase [Symbiobacteriaceae bacterium]
MLLAIDVGNTNLTMGLYLEAELVVTWRLATDRARTADEYGMEFVQLLRREGYSPADVTEAAMASVVPPLNARLVVACHDYLNVRLVELNSLCKALPAVYYDNVAALGTDRLVNAVAAWEIYGRPQGRPAIVVDFGTATKLECISASGEYLGGCIAPGITISTEALARSAARLQRIELAKPRQVLGKNIVASLQSGIIYGFAGQADGLIKRLSKEIAPDGPPPVVVATGGLAYLVAGESRTIQHVEPYLTLEGIRRMYEQNRE